MKTPTLKAYKNNVIVLKAKVADSSKGGILLPDQAKAKPDLGTIVSVGKDVVDLKEGDVIYYPGYQGLEVKLGDVALLSIKDTDVIAVVEQ